MNYHLLFFPHQLSGQGTFRGIQSRRIIVGTVFLHFSRTCCFNPVQGWILYSETPKDIGPGDPKRCGNDCHCTILCRVFRGNFGGCHCPGFFSPLVHFAAISPGSVGAHHAFQKLCGFDGISRSDADHPSGFQ